MPDIFPNWWMNKYTMIAIGKAYSALGGTYRNQIKNLTQFYQPLDLIDKWNVGYGSNGFLQYQFVVPPEAVDPFKEIIYDIQKSATTRL